MTKEGIIQCSTISTTIEEIQRYDILQGLKYVWGRQVDWNGYAHADFYLTVQKYLEDIGWLDLARLPEMNYIPLLVNEFYYGILVHAN